jgi:hypothetical protein
VVTVTTSSGTTQVNGTDWNVDDNGYLTVVDASGSDVATFAAGSWQSVTVILP